MTNNIFDITVSVKNIYHVAYDKIEGIIDKNAKHCKEVKHSTTDDY